MNEHSFDPSPLDKSICRFCKRKYIAAHSPITTCEACGKVCKITLFGDADNPKSMLLCKSCTDNEIKAAVKALEDTPDEIKDARINDMNARLNLARDSYQAIRYSGDYFNNETIAIESVRESINANESLSADEKAFKFQSYLADMIAHVKERVFELDEEKHKEICKDLAARKSLRDMERELRAEIRERIKATDSQYDVKIAKPVKPKIKKETLGTFDRLVQMYMMLHSCSKDEALDAIRKGSGGKFTGELPK